MKRSSDGTYPISAFAQANSRLIRNALYGGLAFLRAPENRPTAVKLIAEIDEIPNEIAEAELDGNIVMSTTGEFRPERMERALEMAKLIGMTDLAPAADAYVTQFKPLPTKA